MRTCTVDGCGRPHRAKGYCSSHYNATFAPDRHVTIRACDGCGEVYTTTRTNGRYCSLLCWNYSRGASMSCKIPTPRARRIKPTPFVPVLRECAWCGEAFMARRDDHVMCQRRCKIKAKGARRRARETGASGSYTWSEVTRVYLDLGSVCAYCHQPAPNFEPDHVVPLSRGGSNSITNVVPSCPLCNSDKRDLSLSEWAADRARRGLTPRTLDPHIKHLTSALLAA
jgi:5-methylcytosine-specific restriction endonuclease McrA